MSWQNSTDCFKFDFVIVNIMRSFSSFKTEQSLKALNLTRSLSPRPFYDQGSRPDCRTSRTEICRIVTIVYIYCPFKQSLDKNRAKVLISFSHSRQDTSFTPSSKNTLVSQQVIEIEKLEYIYHQLQTLKKLQCGESLSEILKNR